MSEDTGKDPYSRQGFRRPAFIVIVMGVLVVVAILAMLLVSPSLPPPPVQESRYLTISGSTTVQPVSESLANAFMVTHPGVRIRVEGGGSGQGIQKVGTGLTDIGSSSRVVNPDEMTRYPDLSSFKIGGSAVVIIAGRDFSADVVDKSELTALYDDKRQDIADLPGVRSVRNVIQRSDESGTEETFAGWLNRTWTNLSHSMAVVDRSGDYNLTPLGAMGNEGVLKAVIENPDTIGFVDLGFAEREPAVKILRVSENSPVAALPADISHARDLIRMELNIGNGNNTYYISRLTRPLLYITKGKPSPLEDEFIRFAMSEESNRYYDDVGYFSTREIEGTL
jgi:phosphate transport system substrate-binding protein